MIAEKSAARLSKLFCRGQRFNSGLTPASLKRSPVRHTHTHTHTHTHAQQTSTIHKHTVKHDVSTQSTDYNSSK